jgi:chemotaxis protein methyltransferase CheR
MLKNEQESINLSDSLKMTNEDFRQLSRYVTEFCGIKLPDGKRLMLEGRLRKRLNHLGMKSFKEYCKYLFSPEGQKNETFEMIDLVSTNKTDFFRESEHFDYLTETALPNLEELGIGLPDHPLKIWSAGCSTGEEPHTMAMVLSEYGEIHRAFRFSIFASDISTRVLRAAAMAIYSETKTAPIPFALKKKYLMKSKNPADPRVRFVPEIRSKISFARLNFMELDPSSFQKFNIIFCRNVIIYFDRPTQEKLINKFHDCLEHGGYLFLGHSEALTWMKLPFESVAPMVYRKI